MTEPMDWPHVPKHRDPDRCDHCHRDAEPGSALCAGCADRVWCAERDAAEGLRED